MTTTTKVSGVNFLRDHWQWRPDWAVDRAYLLWYLTFVEAELEARIHTVQQALTDVPALDLVPPSWLHVTLDDVGFVDELLPAVVDDVIAAARVGLRDVELPSLRLGPIATTASAVVLLAEPADELSRLRDRLRAATIAVLGTRALAELQNFRPHVSLAYASRAVARESLEARLSATQADPIVVPTAQVTLAAVTRRDHHYQWTVREVLGG